MAENQRTDGLLGGDRHYDGRGLGEIGIWKCPSCRAENSGPLDAGCASCGAGSARPSRVGTPPPSVEADLHLPGLPAADHIRVNGQGARQAESLRAGAAGGLAPGKTFADVVPAVGFEDWWRINEPAVLRLEPKEIARLAWECSAISHTTRTMAAPPVTADVEQLAPEGKPRRTIIAALEIFRDQVLPNARDEIASGEWCSPEEIEQLLTELRRQEDET